MRCTYPRTVGYQADGKTISWSQKTYSKEYSSFQLPCGKCLECRLEYARQWAVRCVHEAQMYENNCFLTLTYDEKSLLSDKLYYVDFQKFVKKLRKHIYIYQLKKMYPNEQTDEQRITLFKQLSKETKNEIIDQIRIGIFVTGEYGDKEKRPHWHACVFNWRPHDAVYKYSNNRGDKIYESQTLSDLWGKGICEFGDVTMESAGYCARYAAKKLCHGNDEDHEYHPISRKSSKQAIGKKWLEKYWPDVFNYGHIILPNGDKCSIPRYYEKWLKKEKPQEYERYVMETKAKRISKAVLRTEAELKKERQVNEIRRAAQGYRYVAQRTKNEAKRIILEEKFKQLQQKLKL